jgi:hypothetical protein
MKYLILFLGLASLVAGCQPRDRSTPPAIAQRSEADVRLLPEDSLEGRPIAWYFAHPDLYPDVRRYLNDSLTLADNAETRILLDTLVAYSGELQPLYFRVLNKICKNAGSDLNHILGGYAMDMLERHTPFCLDQLRKGGPDYFTGFISNELYQRPNWQEELRLYTDRLYGRLPEGSDELKKELDYLLEGIVNDIEHMIRND